MAAFGQTFDSNAWLIRGRSPIVYQKIDVGATSSVGHVVWSSWWLTTWVFLPPPFFDQGRFLRSVWLTSPVSISSEWKLLQHTAPDVGQTVWNNWFFNTPYTPAAKLGFFAGGAIYPYSGSAAGLGAQRNFVVSASGTFYTYAGADAARDMGIHTEFVFFDEEGGDLGFVGHSITLSLDAGHYFYGAGTATGFRPLKGMRQGPILTTSTRMIFGPKRVSEELAAPFDFSTKTVAGDVLSLPVVTVTVWRGVDGNPQALYQGSTLISGTVAYATLVDGVAGVIYQIEMTVTASLSGVLSLMGFLTVLPDSL